MSEAGKSEELLRQQTTLARFGELALRSDDLDEILTEGCRLVSEALGTDLAKVVELQEDGETLLVRAGVGWKPGVVGEATIKLADNTSESYALRSGKPMISPNIENETRFQYPQFLIDNGAKAVANVVIIGGKDRPAYGILQIDSRQPREFTESDTAFLSGYANLLAATVDRFRIMREVRDKNAQLGEALAEAEKASRAKTDFMGVMSHELRTPMHAVTSCAVLLSHSKLDSTQRRTLGVLEDASKQMLAVLNDLLDLSALNADKVRIEREPISLLRLIEDAAAIWAAAVRAKGLSLSVIIDPSLSAPRDADGARLLQVMGNLVANAVKFTQEGSISLRAWPERGPGASQRVAIEVEDTGPGVPPEAAERIFQPFEQVDVSAKRRRGGLGLGLHIARRLALAMGGDVEIKTHIGQGSRFTARIEAPLSEAVPKSRYPLPATDEEMQVRNILCVDDNPRNLYVLGALLRSAGHRTTECDSGAEALDLLAERKFDVVLLDMVMPEMDGLAVLEKLRAGDGPNAGTPVIACTASVLPEQIESYSKAGSAAVLAKPIDLRAMLQTVATVA